MRTKALHSTLMLALCLAAPPHACASGGKAQRGRLIGIVAAQVDDDTVAQIAVRACPDRSTIRVVAAQVDDQRGALFEVRLAPGKVVVKRGSVPPRFVTQATQILHHEPVRGRILGLRDGNGVRLVFSRSIPEPVAQRLRNIFPYGDYRGLSPSPDGRKSR